MTMVTKTFDENNYKIVPISAYMCAVNGAPGKEDLREELELLGVSFSEYSEIISSVPEDLPGVITHSGSSEACHVTPWQERCLTHPDHQTSMVNLIIDRMQEEIDELRGLRL